jgi:DNA-binding LytR/AlgR family response regulator
MKTDPERNIKCIIVDDEPLAIDVLRALLDKFDHLDIVAECGDSFQAFEVLRNNDIHLMFLDIHMPELSGLDFLKNLASPPAVILTTAHREFALEAFELDVIDYLLKPISGPRLMKALEKFHKIYSSSEQSPSSKKAGSGYIMIRADRKSRKVFYSDIDYVESIKDYVRIHTGDEKIMSRMTLSDLESKLPLDTFLRVHRSYIVNLNKITAITTHDVEIGLKEVPIGDSYRADLDAKINP